MSVPIPFRHGQKAEAFVEARGSRGISAQTQLAKPGSGQSIHPRPPFVEQAGEKCEPFGAALPGQRIDARWQGMNANDPNAHHSFIFYRSGTTRARTTSAVMTAGT
jgi:hypothetical protein